MLKFLAGTNYAIDTKLIKKVGGWDQKALTEDAELGLRLYVKEKAFAKLHPYEEIEQGPASFKVWFNQRKRWAAGFLQLIPKMANAELALKDKMDIFRRAYVAPVNWVLTQICPYIAPAFMLSGIYRRASFPPAVSYFSTGICIGGLIYYMLYPHIFNKVEKYTSEQQSKLARFSENIRLSLLTIPYWFVQALPEISALSGTIAKKNDNIWKKTSRTCERILTPENGNGFDYGVSRQNNGLTLEEMLLSARKIDKWQLKRTIKYMNDYNKNNNENDNGNDCQINLGEALVKLGYVDEDSIARFLSRQNGFRYIPSLEKEVKQILPDTLKSLPKSIAKEYNVLPLTKYGNDVVAAVGDISEEYLTEVELQFYCADVTNRHITFVIAPKSKVEKMIDVAYSGADKKIEMP